MQFTKIALGASFAAALSLVSTSGMAQGAPPGRAISAANAETAQTRRAVQAVSADAMAILAAIQRDPTLARQLADRPAGAKQLLAARGATRAESITVTPGDSSGGAARTITITITIGVVTIKIVIKL